MALHDFLHERAIHHWFAAIESDIHFIAGKMRGNKAIKIFRGILDMPL